MKTAELRAAIESMNLTGEVSLDFSRYNCGGENYIVRVGNQQLNFKTSKEQHMAYKMLVNKFGFERYRSNRNEIEDGWAEGTAADMANPKMHGHVYYSILSDNGNSGVFYWDYYKQKAVKKEDLTIV